MNLNRSNNISGFRILLTDGDLSGSSLRQKVPFVLRMVKRPYTVRGYVSEAIHY